MMNRLHALARRIAGPGDPRWAYVVLGGFTALLIGTVLCILSGDAGWLVPAALGTALALVGLVILDDARSRAVPPDAEPAEPPPELPALRIATASPQRPAAPVAPPEPLALPRNRTYPESLKLMLEADAVILPEGHVWPDSSRNRGSLATRAQLAQRAQPPGPIAAVGEGAPLYVSFASPADVAQGLFIAALGYRATPIVALLDAAVHPGLSTTERHAVDDAVARAWISAMATVLTPPPVQQLLASLSRDPAGPGGGYLLELLEQIRLALRSCRGTPAAMAEWARWRAVIATEAERQHCSLDQRAAAEVLCDWLMLQRACVEDITVAERDRGPGETRGDVLMRIDGQGTFLFERTLSELLDPGAVARYAPDAARAAGPSLGPMPVGRGAASAA
ncbi:MAG: hypothetical protein SFW08_12205 [Gemmatimonadaceae bacterium]|nr:hypothetical protein [Gemmatimonadaceae bacterium]